MYYLQSRYYNPSWGRFINADGIIGQTGELLGHNLFAYCVNNTINLEDPSGFRPMYAGEETDAMREASFAAMATATRNNTSNSKIVNSSSSFNYKGSAGKGTASGLLDKAGEVVSGRFIKEKKVWQSLETLTLGKYVSNLSISAKFGKKALGAAGTIVFTIWDVTKDFKKGEYYSAKVDIASAIGGVAAVAGTVSFGLSLGAGIVIDKYATYKKDVYYGR